MFSNKMEKHKNRNNSKQCFYMKLKILIKFFTQTLKIIDLKYITYLML